jgi:hypothetical protein
MPKKKEIEEETVEETEEATESENSDEKKEESKKEKAKAISEKDYEKKVLDLAKTGLTAEKIGEALRKEGVHSKDYGKKISKILGDKYVSPDLKNVEEKLKRIAAHAGKNIQDKRAKREKDRVFSQVRKVKKHLKLI